MMPGKKPEVVQLPLSLNPVNNEEERLESYVFPKKTPIYRESGSLVYAEKVFIAQKIKNEKIAGYPAFQLVSKTLVYAQRGWNPKNYFWLDAGLRFGASTSTKSDYRPKKLSK